MQLRRLKALASPNMGHWGMCPPTARLQTTQFFMVALWNRADHYIFTLWFLSSLFSSPNLSGRTLGVHYTHGVALVRI